MYGLLFLATLLVASVLAPRSDAFAAQPTVGLGTADPYAVLAGSGVTNTGNSVLNGNLGTSPTPAITGFPPGIVNGATHAADAAALQAQSDLTTAYNDAAARTPAASVTADLGGSTLTAGVYRASSSMGLTGAVTLDAQGNAGAVFIFQAGSTLTTASASHVNLINGAQACNVFWQVGSSATLGTSSVFAGNILALTTISMNDGVTVTGRALARNGAVTLINDTITTARCAAGTGTTGAGGTGGNGSAIIRTTPRSVATSITRFGTTRCVQSSFRAVVEGSLIRRVVFSVNRVVIARDRTSPFSVTVPDGAGIRTVRAVVTYRDGTTATTLSLRFRSCAAALASPARPTGGGGFTG